MSSYYYKVIKEDWIPIMDDHDLNKLLHEMVYQIPVCDLHPNDLENSIQAFSNVMLEMDSSNDVSSMSYNELEKYYTGSRFLFMRQAENNPNACIMDIINLCMEELSTRDSNVTHLNNCLDLKPARNTKGFGNS